MTEIEKIEEAKKVIYEYIKQNEDNFKAFFQSNYNYPNEVHFRMLNITSELFGFIFRERSFRESRKEKIKQ
ncbi:MAG: hypothetical protein AB1567_06910 [bacterium]